MVFRHSTSMSEIRNTAKITKNLTKNLVIKATDFSTYFSYFLANSKGKDKFIALFQYLFEFICICGKHSNIPELAIAYKNKQLPDMRIYYHVKQSISSARKVFRLFRFFDEIKGMMKMIQSEKPWSFKILSIFTYCCSITYYLSDNLLWVINILVISNVVDSKARRNWKYRKNISSLFRIISYLSILVYSLVIQSFENTSNMEILKEIQKYSPQQMINRKSFIVTIDGRRKKRFLILELVLSIFRFFMLVKSLKLRGYEHLDPVFVGLCGLCSALLNLIKVLFQKKIIIDLKRENSYNRKQISLQKISTVSD